MSAADAVSRKNDFSHVERALKYWVAVSVIAENTLGHHSFSLKT